MKLLFTCGGTAGHIYPAVAVAKAFRARFPDAEILFVGADGEMETRLVPREGFPIRTVTIAGFSRRLKPSHILFNLKTLRKLRVSHRQAAAILDEYRPDLVIGTGGYASYPLVRAATARHIPTMIHESNAVPGLTTKRLAKKADRVLVNYEECRRHYPHPDRVLVTGTPIRGEFFSLGRREAREKLGLPPEKPLVLSYWGSLGARDMNHQMEEFIRLVCADDAFCHLHAAGKVGYTWLPDRIRELGVDLSAHPDVRLVEFIYDMPAAMAAADLVISRAGASTLAELTGLAKPCILVPSPHVTNNHQERNARLLEARGGAVVITEAESSGALLYEKARSLLEDPEKLRAMKQAQSGLSAPDAAERIVEAGLSLLR
ncbi:MAG: UDP-N-acetylglucosamine--N-acetylmuramyl-(pentapeptide) pyrophosphoryl-undecaprenol N-acetylglucosamine transferase [Oscillospiraceae bacterium]|nr:UDP-N-acetylglucosamine--N-acetylmuramyl-(pentapeptide) pyrophosphoryl-undecaprenol N-acetylglucosamine transferase [Oscillospiraceae bacterium]